MLYLKQIQIPKILFDRQIFWTWENFEAPKVLLHQMSAPKILNLKIISSNKYFDPHNLNPKTIPPTKMFPLNVC